MLFWDKYRLTSTKRNKMYCLSDGLLFALAVQLRIVLPVFLMFAGQK
jgi:hypothetical protein